ncbi:MAG: Spy/CpxP family protein refolding chaperone [Bacteroidales bacterium]|jgi:Spy/CpxP family protein refolding chaperone
MGKYSKTILIVLVVFLLGINIAVIITYRTHLKNDEQALEQIEDIPPRQFGNFIAQELDLDASQEEQFRDFRRLYNRSANRTLMAMNGVRSRMARELKSVGPDRDQLDKLAGQLGEMHKRLKILTFDYYCNMQSVLRPEQQEKLSVLFQSMLSAPVHSPGRSPRSERSQMRNY